MAQRTRASGVLFKPRANGLVVLRQLPSWWRVRLEIVPEVAAVIVSQALLPALLSLRFRLLEQLLHEGRCRRVHVRRGGGRSVGSAHSKCCLCPRHQAQQRGSSARRHRARLARARCSPGAWLWPPPRGACRRPVGRLSRKARHGGRSRSVVAQKVKVLMTSASSKRCRPRVPRWQVRHSVSPVPGAGAAHKPASLCDLVTCSTPCAAGGAAVCSWETRSRQRE